MYKYIIAASCMLTQLAGNNQQLKAGELFPDIPLQNVLNWKTPALRVGDIGKKLIIFDFWSFSCTACLEAFPKIDSLQKEFGPDVQFVAVNNESAAMTQKFMETRKRIRFPDIPFVTGDTLLEQFFPRAYVPWHVWLDGSGRIRFITDGYNATRKHITDFLAGKDPGLRQLEFDSAYSSKSSLLGDERLTRVIRSYSYIAQCIPEFSISNYFGEEGDGRFRMSYNCASVEQLFQEAFGERGKYNFDFPVTRSFPPDGADDSYRRPLDPDKLGSWTQHHCYSYDLVVPVASAGEVFSIMQRDLGNYFGLEARIEKKEVDCYALTRLKPSREIGAGDKRVAGLDRSNWYIERNVTTERVINSLNNLIRSQQAPAFIIDRTGSKQPVSLAIDRGVFSNGFSLTALNAALKEYNLVLIAARDNRDVLIVTRKSNKL